MRDYDELLAAGNAAQLEKLKENDHKDGWNELPVGYLTILLEEELKELFHEVWTFSRDHARIRREAADVANFAHMIILRCDQELQSSHEEESA